MEVLPRIVSTLQMSQKVMQAGEQIMSKETFTQDESFSLCSTSFKIKSKIALGITYLASV